ncbi:MAG TPA: pitrilysin family protein [Candidatus Eisenbacteria bacterium]|nr:pitrilysin family protein [Candidatus Eisenbacteria bacterium]
MTPHRLPAPPAVARVLAAALALLALAAPAPRARAADIVAHPDQLRFPPADYVPPRAADHRVRLANGLVAYLVPDPTTPLVTVSVLMRVGPQLDPPGREGLAAMTLHLLTRSGTAAMSADALEARLAQLGAQLESGVGGGGGGFFGGGAPLGPSEGRASLNLLARNLDEGLGLLAACLATPAFEAGRVALDKDQQLQAMKRRNDESGAIEEREWGVLTRGAGHWSNRWPTQASLQAITADDLRAFQRRWIGPRNFVLAVSGDFDRRTIVKQLERAFARWPAPTERAPAAAPPAAPEQSGWFLVDKDVNQGRVSIGVPGVSRYDPDWAAARVMNDILGGGGFTARLVNRIRSDEGLAYSVGSRLEGGNDAAGPWRLQFQSKVRSVAYATQIALEEIRRMRDSLVTPGELEASKNKFVESLPAQFETAGAIAGTLAAEELTGRYLKDPGYFADYAKRIEAVSAADVQRVAQRLLDPAKLTVLLVGNAGDMLLGDPKHDASLAKLAGGEPRRLPLRDPLSMKPLAAN